MLKRIFLVLSLCLVALSCSKKGFESKRQKEVEKFLTDNDRLKILTTTEMIKYLVDQIGEEKVCSISLITKDLDPHSYELVKGDDDLLYSSDLIVSNGLGLEHGASLSHFLHSSSKNIFLGDHLKNTSADKLLYVDGVVDPHVWMDISLWVELVDPIVRVISDKIPESKDLFIENGIKLKNKLTVEHKKIQEQLRSLPQEKRYLVTTHDAFNYFTRSYLAFDNEVNWTIRCVAPEGLSPEMQLNSYDIQKIIDHLDKYQIQVLFTEKGANQDSIRKVLSAARDKNLNVSISTEELCADSMIQSDNSECYIEMMRHNANVLYKSLLGNNE